jgi:hypothetical protein
MHEQHPFPHPASAVSSAADQATPPLTPEPRTDELPSFAGTRSLPPAGDGPFPQVPGYSTLAKLGSGGMGVVYLARHQPLQRLVALKMISGSAGPEQVQRFKTEAEAAARLQHPHIVGLFEIGEHAGLPFIALEYCPGGSLEKRLAGTPLPAAVAAPLLEQLARAMHAAHQKGILHRDLKPANVLLAEDGTAKVSDFGLARLVDVAGHTASGAVLGTPSYMAPEQARGQGQPLDPRCDIYALGAILYEVLTGRPPFRADNPVATLAQVLYEEAVPPGQLNPRVPRDLQTICLKCLHKEPGRRYGTALELAEDLRRYRQGEPIYARPVGRLERTGKWVRRNKGLSAGLAAAVLALLAGTGVALWQAVEARAAAAAEAGQRRQVERERDAKEKAATAEREARGKADAAAAAERKANEEAQRRLAQITKAKGILADVFRDLNPLLETQGGPRLAEQLAERVSKAAALLEGEAIADAFEIAELQATLGHTLTALGRPAEALAAWRKASQTYSALLGPEDPYTLISMHNLAGAYMAADRLDLALPLYIETLEKRKKTLGADHPDTLSTMHRLGQAYRAAGQLDLAVPLLEETVKIMLAKSGHDHQRTLLAMNSLAGAYKAADRLDLALPLLVETLEKQKAQLGLDHPNTLATMHNLAQACQAAGLLDLALPLQVDTVARMKLKLGPDHPETLTAQYALAREYRDAGQLDRALPLYVDVLQKRKAKLGPYHSDTLISASGLAGAYRAAGQPEQARTLLLATLDKMKAQLGPDHPETLIAMHFLAAAHRDAGRPDLALPLYAETLKAMKVKLGPDHPETLIAMNGQAVAYQASGRLDLALPLLIETVDRMRAQLGLDHSYTLTAMHKLAWAYQAANQLGRALPLYLDTLEKMKTRLGADHPDRLVTLSNLGGAYRAAGQLDRALPVLVEAADKLKAKLGPDHRYMLHAMHQLALAYRTAGQLDLALPLYVDTLQKRQAKLGPDHPDTLSTQQNLAVAYCGVGRVEEALPLFVDALARRKARLGPDHPDTLTTTFNLGEAYCDAGRFADAEPLLATWLEKKRPQRRAPDMQVAQALYRLGECRVLLKKYAAAEPPLRYGLAICLKKQPNSFARHGTANLLGAALAGQKKYADAEPLLLDSARALAGAYAKLPPPVQRQVLAVVQRVIDLYDAWDRPDDAAMWRKKLQELTAPQAPQ